MKKSKSVALPAALVLVYSAGATAQLSFHDPATNQGILDQVVAEFATRAAAWQGVVMDAAMWLFWTLGTISLVWTGGMLILRKADIGEFFAEFVRFILFFGFFLWLLRNGPVFADSIIRSLRQIGDSAAGTSGLSPSGIVDIGFLIWKQAISNLTIWQPIDSFIGLTLSAGILLLLAAVAINMLLLLVSAWILMYAGIFFLGFGGSRWTSDMAINYYKTVLGVAVQLMAMVLLIGIGNDLLSTFYAKMNKGTLNFEELGVMLVFCFALLMLINRIPSLLAGIITGGVSGGIGNFGAGAIAGAAIGAAGMAATAAGMAGGAMVGGMQNIAGGVSAVKAAIEKAQTGMDSHSGQMPSFGSFSDSAGGDSSGAGSTPFAQAAGFSGSLSMAGESSDFGSSARSTRAKDDKTEDQAVKAQNGSSVNQAKADSGESSDGKAQNGASGQPDSRSGQGSDGPQEMPRSSGPSVFASAAKAAGTAGRIAVDAGAILAKGTASVARAKASSMKEAAMERIADTPGGRIAAAIREQRSADETPDPTFGENSLAPSPESEVAAFVNRDRDTKTT
jgi:type IV secretion system protein TrbL